MADLGCQLDTSGKRKNQLRSSIIRVACGISMERFLDCWLIRQWHPPQAGMDKKGGWAGSGSKAMSSSPPRPLLSFLPSASTLNSWASIPWWLRAMLSGNKPFLCHIGFGQCFIISIESKPGHYIAKATQSPDPLQRNGISLLPKSVIGAQSHEIGVSQCLPHLPCTVHPASCDRAGCSSETTRKAILSPDHPSCLAGHLADPIVV